MFPTLCDLPRLLCPWNSPGKGVCCYSLLQGNLPNQEIKLRSPASQVISLLCEPPGKPPKYGMIHEFACHPCSRAMLVFAAAAAKSLQLCPTLCDPIDSSPPGSSVPGILQTRTLEWVAISFSNAWKWKVKVKLLSCVWLFATPWTAAYQAPLPMGFSRQEYWSGLPLPSLLVFSIMFQF